MVALGLQEALAQDYDGIIRIAPAIPDGWDFDGTVALRHGVRASLQIRGGVPTAVGLEAKFAQKLKMKSPWPGELVCVSNAETGEIVADATSSPVVEFPAKANAAYRIERASEKGSFVSVDAVPALTFKRLGSVQIGLGREHVPKN